MESLRRKVDTRGLLRAGWLPAAVFGIVLLSRLPFLDAGYGFDPDAWVIALTGRTIFETGSYKVSRFPGYPLHEFGAAFLHHGGAVALNGATAVFSAVASTVLLLIMRALGRRDWDAAFVALTFAFTPVVIVQSTASMDYLWAVAFVLGAVLAALKRRPVAAGVLLGMAIGARITSGAMLLPVAVLILQRTESPRRIREVVKLAGAMCLVGAAWFAPVVERYGTNFFRFYESGYPAWELVRNRATTGVWGHQGWLALQLALVVAVVIVARRWRTIGRSSLLAPELAWLVAVALLLASYVRLPLESGYLVPLVPFVLLLLYRALPWTLFAAFCVTVSLASYVEINRSGLDDGAVIAMHDRRTHQERVLERVIERIENLEGPSVIVIGAWRPRFELVLGSRTMEHATFVNLLGREEAEAYLAQGYQLYFMSDQAGANRRARGLDLPDVDAIPIDR